MSQSKEACPHCRRDPGDSHSDGCSRSRQSMRRISVRAISKGGMEPVPASRRVEKRKALRKAHQKLPKRWALMAKVDPGRALRHEDDELYVPTPLDDSDAMRLLAKLGRGA